MPPSRRRSARKRLERSRGSLALAGVLALLVGVNLYFFFIREGTSVRDVSRQVQIERANALKKGNPGAAAKQAAPGGDEALSVRTREGKVRRGDNLEKILVGREGVTAPDAHAVVSALQPVFDFHTLRDGQAYRVELDDEGRLASFELRSSPTVLYRVERDAEGKLVARKAESRSEVRVEEVTGLVTYSLYDAVKQQGEKTELIALLVDLFAYDIDFYNETRAGDRFKLVLEKEYVAGRLIGYRRVLAAEYAGHVGTYRAFYFQPQGGRRGGYFDERGQSVEKSLLRTPLRFTRVSSRFNPRRFHPVLHRVRGHFGTDYAAPQGTPVWAAAAGRVVSAGKHAGGGNTIVLAHSGGMQTTYMHLSRFAKGLRAGERVAQKQVIGYVGSTGLSTGPHLHFTLRVNGRPVDAQKVKGARGPSVPAGQLASFKVEIADREVTLHRLDVALAAQAAARAVEAAAAAAVEAATATDGESDEEEAPGQGAATSAGTGGAATGGAAAAPKPIATASARQAG